MSAFKLPDSFYEKQKEIYEKKYIEYNGENIHVSVFEDKSITGKMLNQMRMNSYAREDLTPKLTNNALIETAEHYLQQCSKQRYPSST